MPDFELTGTVGPFGQQNSNLPTLDLFYSVVIGNLSGRGFSQSGIIQTQANDSFSVTISVPDFAMASFGPASMLIIDVNAYVPLENRRDVRLVASLEGNDQEIFDQAAAAAQGLLVEVDLTNCRRLEFAISATGEVPELDGVNELALSMLSDPNETTTCIGSITARRDGNTFRGRVICREDDLDAARSWLLLERSRVFPMNRLPVRPIDFGRTFTRTRALTGADAQDDASSTLAFSRIQSATGVGTISSRLPEVVNEGILSVRDMDLDFIDGNLRVRGRVSVQLFGVGLFGIGRFQVSLSVSPIERRRLPFRDYEVTRPLAVGVIGHTYDLFPDTDLDEVGVGQGDLEGFISGIVAETVREKVEEEIGSAVNDEIDEMFDDLSEALDNAGLENPEGLVNEMRSTLFFHIDNVAVDADNVRVRVFAGLRHFMAGFQALNCAANVASTMFAARRPMPMFRRYQRALSHPKLAQWMDRYKKHAGELAKIALRDPSLTAQVIRVASDLEPVLNEWGGIPLTEHGISRLREIAEIAKKAASRELAEVIDEGMKVLEAGAGHGLAGLVDLAAEASLETKGEARA